MERLRELADAEEAVPQRTIDELQAEVTTVGDIYRDGLDASIKLAGDLAVEQIAFEAARVYFARVGHLRVPVGHVEELKVIKKDVPLGAQLKIWRKAYREDTANPDRAPRLHPFLSEELAAMDHAWMGRIRKPRARQA
ncbi:hypothetical protein QFZ82_000309 [Streptomyces sp. V4I23]|uniref:helicase associated domain-containing protein n=1 Tax=Streptomyces sp. V4I23 TaxID=3042282 RepID=UPI002789FF05|nr:helicase associated domain-containing protein [Streptomyces sp. V4I23]MDQ1005824.1 hypothetical protein [Streptomyces sp. V4I23]